MILDQKDTFNLLSIGHRAVGKTVFLVGAYTELNSSISAQRNASYWFECQDKTSHESLNSILRYISETGNYPPSTLKTSDFYLSLKQDSTTLCNLHWWDIPGELCDFENLEFQEIVLNSHSCCVFINAERLVHDTSYKETLVVTIQQVSAIANLIRTIESPYSFALIFTQCDRLGKNRISQLQIEQRIQDLVSTLDAVRATYRRFYSSIPIIEISNKFKLNPQGSAIAILWLISNLRKKNNSSSNSTLALLLEQSEQVLDLNDSPQKLPLQQSKIRLITGLILAGFGLIFVGCLIWLYFNHYRSREITTNAPQNEQLLEQYKAEATRNPRDLQTLIMLNNLYIGRNQYEQAIPIIKKIIELQPLSLEWQMTLARVHDLAGQPDAAEQVYRQILRKDKQHFEALYEIAKLRKLQGDISNAKLFFQQAEKAASSPSLRAQVRDEIRQLSD